MFAWQGVVVAMIATANQAAAFQIPISFPYCLCILRRRWVFVTFQHKLSLQYRKKGVTMPEQMDPGAAPVQLPQAVEPSIVATPTPTKPATLFSLIRAGDDEGVKKFIVKKLSDLVVKHGLENYKIVFLFDDVDSITDYHSDQIYKAISKTPNSQDILLIVQSRGGRVEPAYLISKTCKKLAKDKFIVAIPRKAKSAATLLALGADEIHLGLMSQLGPIDLQVNDMPALGLANGVTKVTKLASEYPASAEMWAKYLSENLSLRHLGYMERLGESTAQYAERLLKDKKLPDGQTAKLLADHFVNHYKDHAFLIDIDEATSLLGAEIVRSSSAEYAFANEAYQEFNTLELWLRVFHQKEFWFVGAIDADSLSIRIKS